MTRTALFVLFTSFPFANASAQPFAIEKSVIAGGGGTSAGGSFSLSGTIGQHDAGIPMTGGNFTLTGGFWAGDESPGTRLCADQNEDGQVTPTDFTAWIANFNANDLRADTNQDGLVTPTDFTAWIAAFNQGINGPICSP
jgi:hypothetical protein